VSNLFTQAKELKQPEKPGKTSDAPVELEGLKQLAELKTVIDALEGLRETVDQDVKARAFDMFCEKANGRKPENFKATDGYATGSIMLRKRTTRSALTDSELIVLRGFGLEPAEQVVKNEMYGINPVYAEDHKLLEMVSKALQTIVPADFFVKQSKQSTYVVDDNMVTKAFELGASKDVIQMLTTMAINANIKDVPLNEVFQNVKVYLGEDDDA
jgi:hypothetical protein